jgi:hypothetical protein
VYLASFATSKRWNRAVAACRVARSLFSAVVLAFPDAPLASLAVETLPRELAAAMVLDAGSLQAPRRVVPRSSRKVRLIVAS